MSKYCRVDIKCSIDMLSWLDGADTGNCGDSVTYVAIKKIAATFISTHQLSVRFERKDDRRSISRTALYQPRAKQIKRRTEKKINQTENSLKIFTMSKYPIAILEALV